MEKKIERRNGYLLVVLETPAMAVCPYPLWESAVLPSQRQRKPVTQALNYFKVLTLSLFPSWAVCCWGRGNLKISEEALCVQLQWNSKAAQPGVIFKGRETKGRGEKKPLSDLPSSLITLDVVLQRSS